MPVGSTTGVLMVLVSPYRKHVNCFGGGKSRPPLLALVVSFVRPIRVSRDNSLQLVSPSNQPRCLLLSMNMLHRATREESLRS